jgi:hypothetical protein
MLRHPIKGPPALRPHRTMPFLRYRIPFALSRGTDGQYFLLPCAEMCRYKMLDQGPGARRLRKMSILDTGLGATSTISGRYSIPSFLAFRPLSSCGKLTWKMTQVWQTLSFIPLELKQKAAPTSQRYFFQSFFGIIMLASLDSSNFEELRFRL